MARLFIAALLGSFYGSASHVAKGDEVPYVMREVGHTDPKVTLGLHGKVGSGKTASGSGWRHSSTATNGHKWAQMERDRIMHNRRTGPETGEAPP